MATGHDPEPLDREPLGRDPLDREPLGREPVGREPLDREPRDRAPLGGGALGREALGGEARGGESLGDAGDAPPPVELAQEELVVDTDLVETGRARLVKRVAVETVTRTIELRREVLEVIPLDPATPDGALNAAVLSSGPLAPGSFVDAEVEIVLMEERAVVSTEVVARERVRLRKAVVTEAHEVEADLGGEHVDLEQRAIPPS